MKTFRAIITGLIAGTFVVLAIWLTRVVLPPRTAELPTVIKLDTLAGYAARRSGDPIVLLEESRLLDRVVDQFEVSEVSRTEAIARLAEAAKVNIVVDRGLQTEEETPFMKDLRISISTRGATIDQILERIFRDEGYDLPVWAVRDGMVLVAKSSRYLDFGTVLRVYDVRDLMLQSQQFSRAFPTTTQPSSDKYDSILHGSEQEAAERLIQLLNTEDEQMQEAPPSIRYFGGKLVVRATRASHRLVEARLGLLRKRD